MSDAINLSQSVAVDGSIRKFRRLVTGDDADGKAIFLKDEICPNVHAIMGTSTFATTELWKTFATPAILAKEAADPAAGPTGVPPPLGGTVFRVVEFPPDRVWLQKQPNNAGAMMHKTPSIDYAYVIDGEIYAVLDKGEALMQAGDVLIQRGTNHAWANRSERPCRVLFVLVSATLPAG